MLLKAIEYPWRAFQMEALVSRIKSNHSSIPLINHDHQLIIAGYRGEMAVDYPLSFLPEDEYYILHDLRLWSGKHFFQIDILILHAKYILILEVKNIVGEIYLDADLHQMIRIKDNEKTSFADPILQVNRLQRQLTSFLINAHFPNIPVNTLIVFSNTNSLLRLSSNQVSKYKNIIVHKEYLPELIPNLTLSFKENILTPIELKKLSSYFKKKHTPLEKSILEKYQIKDEEIITGVKCAKCSQYFMKKVRKLWYCFNCQHKSASALLPALRDYYLLFGESITNQQLRHFLNLDSVYTASRILKHLKLKVTGTHKSTVHHLTPKLFKEVK